jgi:hypothetical protein
MNCDKCKFFIKNFNSSMGVCRRYPIVVVVAQEDFCGEFKKK